LFFFPDTVDDDLVVKEGVAVVLQKNIEKVIDTVVEEVVMEEGAVQLEVPDETNPENCAKHTG
jgi:hypothetical protein